MRLIKVDSFDSEDTFGTVLTFRGRDPEGERVTVEVFLGYSADYGDEYDDKIESWSPYLEVVWDGAVDYTDYVDVSIPSEYFVSGRIDPDLKRKATREMERVVDRFIKRYPEFKRNRQLIIEHW